LFLHFLGGLSAGIQLAMLIAVLPGPISARSATVPSAPQPKVPNMPAKSMTYAGMVAVQR
jgi:hypothetical protein